MARGARPRLDVSTSMYDRIRAVGKDIKRATSTVLDRAVMAALNAEDPGWAASLRGKAREDYTYYRHHSKRDKRDASKRDRATINVRAPVGLVIDKLADDAGTTTGGWLDDFITACLDKEQPHGPDSASP